jgi:capsular exopolysaccharide synthesis family protein
VSRIFNLLNRGKLEAADEGRPPIHTQPEPHRGVPVESGNGGGRLPKPDTQAAPEEAPSTAPIRSAGIQLPEASPLLPFEGGRWRPSEQYRILRTRITQHPKQPRLIVISSPAPGDGKSVTATNTAGALSLKSAGRVLLLDADFRKSAIHAKLGLPQSPGLADVLRGRCTLDEAAVQIQEFPNLFVLPAGAPSWNPAELLDSAAWQGLSVSLRSQFRYVILDSPPVGAVTDYDLIQAVCDGVILVVRPDHTNRQLCQNALGAVPDAKFLGVLLNCVPDWWPARRAGGDYYYYSGEKTYPNRNGGAAT